MRPVGRGTLELVELGDTAYGRTTYQPGWRWSDDVRPIVGTDLCDVHHIGFCMQGRLRVAMADGTEMDISADDVFEIPPGHDAWVVGDETFIAVDSRGRRNFGVAPDDDGDRRVLGTIMFTDIVGSTSLAARLGDAAWHGLMAEFNETCRATLDRNHGREVQTTGDGLLAVFARPDRAARAGLAIIRDAATFDMQVRVGLHTGEYEPVGNEMRGLAVHIAARVMSVAGADQVVVSAATAALLDPAAYRVEPLGPRELKGVPAPVQLFGVSTAG
jgi:class 3 adenylate cyclase